MFATHSHDEIKTLLKANAWQLDQLNRSAFSVATDIVEGRQKQHVERELQNRYPERQGRQNQIKAVPVPLAQRYVAEAATAYTAGVKRTVVDADGVTDDVTTPELNAALKAIGYDMHMARMQSFVVLLRSCAQWWQVKRGEVAPTIALPQNAYPIMDTSAGDVQDPSDQRDYVAYVIELSADDGSGKSDKRTFAWVSAAETVLFAGKSPFEPTGTMETFENPFEWPQVEDASYNVKDPTRSELPLQPTVVWHDVDPIGALLPDNDVELALVNLEISIQLSVLLDTIGHQGWSQMVLKQINNTIAPSTITAGATSAISLSPEDTAEYLTSQAPFDQIVGTLKYLVQLLAIAQRQSPNDFTPDAAAAASGFAKQVDSIPKVEAREQRTAQLARVEEVHAWPRMAALFSYVGKLSLPIATLAERRLVTTFEAPDFPETAQEQATRETHALEKGLLTRADLVADRRGITKTEADAVIEEIDRPSDEEIAAAGGVGEDVQRTALNGAQVASLLQVLQAVATRQLARESAVQMVAKAFQMSIADADVLLGPTGTTFFAETEAEQKAKADAAAAPAAAPAQPAAAPPPTTQTPIASVLGGIIGRRNRGE